MSYDVAVFKSEPVNGKVEILSRRGFPIIYGNEFPWRDWLISKCLKGEEHDEFNWVEVDLNHFVVDGALIVNDGMSFDDIYDYFNSNLMSGTFHKIPDWAIWTHSGPKWISEFLGIDPIGDYIAPIIGAILDIIEVSDE